MIYVIRILLFNTCMILLVSLPVVAGENEVIPTTSNPVNVDVLYHNYYKIDLDQTQPLPVSVVDQISQLTQTLKARYYSLLSWTQHRRSNPVEVEPYDRIAHFGRWVSDFKDNTCYTTRVKVLIRDSKSPVVFNPKNPCAVESGTWNEPYAGRTITIPSEIQIDHVVPLKNAYISGAHKWNFKSRCLYGNYLGSNYHLISVDRTENSRKSDKGPDSYMPPNRGHSCTYIKNWLSIKALWNLELSQSEAEAIEEVLRTEHCRPSDLRITHVEILRQRRFAEENSYLCDNVQNGNSSLLQ